MKVVTSSPEETAALAGRLGRRLGGGEAIGLSGPLGAGKTVFVKGLARGLAIDPRDVTSPTFLLVHEIRGRLLLRHLDAYRLRGAAELVELGAGEYFEDGSVVVVEWADRVEELLPPDRLDVRISPRGGDRRELAFAARGPAHAALLAALEGPA